VIAVKDHDGGDGAFEAAARAAKGLVELDQALLAALAETGQAGVAGDLAERPPRDLVRFRGRQAFPVVSGSFAELDVPGLLGEGERERDDRVRRDPGRAVGSKKRLTGMRAELAQQKRKIGAFPNGVEQGRQHTAGCGRDQQ
jgi:hypothetical protein